MVFSASRRIEWTQLFKVVFDSFLLKTIKVYTNWSRKKVNRLLLFFFFLDEEKKIQRETEKETFILYLNFSPGKRYNAQTLCNLKSHYKVSPVIKSFRQTNRYKHCLGFNLYNLCRSNNKLFLVTGKFIYRV